MRARSCGAVRRQLSAFHDGELRVEEQIAVESHLRQCPACRLEAGRLDDLALAIRDGASATNPEDDSVLDAFASNVVSRMKAERDESISGVTERLFADLHLVWAALGATGATVCCVAIVLVLFSFATDERPDSLEAMIATMSSPAGSNQNPVARADASLRMPTAVDSAFPEAVTSGDDAVFALAAVVTREGRIANLKMLHGGGPGSAQLSRRERQQIEAMLDTISKARFEPARYRNSPVAVNMVWLYAHTTVRGKIPAGSRLEPPSKALISGLRTEGALAV